MHPLSRQGTYDNTGFLNLNQSIGTSQQEGSKGKSAIRVTINLEDVVNEEEVLCSILQALRDNQNASGVCDDWWHVTDSHFLSPLASKVIKDPHLRLTI